MPWRHLSKPIESTLPRVSPNGHYGLWAVMMCQCRFICCNKCTILWGGGVVMGEAMHEWGQGEYGKSLCLLFNIIVNLKVLQEITSIFKQFF